MLRFDCETFPTVLGGIFFSFFLFLFLFCLFILFCFCIFCCCFVYFILFYWPIPTINH